MFFSDRFAVCPHVVREPIAWLSFWIKTNCREHVEGEIATKGGKVDEACDVSSSLWIVFPEALQAKHEVYATPKNKEEVAGVCLVVCLWRERGLKAHELEDQGKQDEALDVNLQISK